MVSRCVGEIFLLAVFALARDGRIKPAEWRDRFHRIIRAKSQRHAFIQKASQA